MPTLSRLLLLPPAAALLLGYTASLADAQCTLCEDGSAIDPNGMIGSTLCSDIDAVIGATTPESSTCLDAQLQGYTNCGCPTYPDVFCSMCDDGSFNLAKDGRTKIAFTNQTCADALFVRQEADASEPNNLVCPDIQQYASFCGCPGAPAAPMVCTLCNDMNDADNTVLVNQDTVLDMFGTTCQSAFDLTPFVSTAAECVNSQGFAPTCCAAPGSSIPADSTTTTATAEPTLAPTSAPLSESDLGRGVTDSPTSAPVGDNDSAASRSLATAALGAAFVAAAAAAFL